MGGPIQGYMRDEILETVGRLGPIARAAGLTMVQLALAWVLRRPEVASAIIGATRAEQVNGNVEASGIELTADVLEAIDDALGSVIVGEPEPAPFAESGVRHRSIASGS